MSPRLIDASSILNLINARSSTLRDKPEEFVVLSLTIYELGNALRKEAYKNKTTSPEAAEILLNIISRLVNDMPIYRLEIDDPVKVLNLAGRHGLSFYDAAYLYIAKKEGYALVTDDSKLYRETVKEGVEALSAVDIDKLIDH
jgi:predicted nucleic acid-binding protein